MKQDFNHLPHTKQKSKLNVSCFERQNAATAYGLPEVPPETYIITGCYDLHRPEKQTAKPSDLQRGRKNIPGVACNRVSWPFIKPTHNSQGDVHQGRTGGLSISGAETLLFRAGPSHSVCWRFGEDHTGAGELLKPQTVYRVSTASTRAR